MPLVKFTFTDPDRSDVTPPPDDALERASWLHLQLCHMLHRVMLDDDISEEERRREAGILATKITQATPNHEIHQARKAIADDETKTEKPVALGGKVVESATTGQSSHLHADAPRGREAKS